jgi:2-hydroxy-6-oxonona-2,4-dienedioate hydrolase
MKSAIFRSDASRTAMERAYDRLLEDTPQARPLRVPTRFGETHLLVAGPEQAPPLVVLHGALANSAAAIRTGHALLDKFRVYALDIIGQSVKSADVRLFWRKDDHASWLLDVLDGLHLPRAHVMGASSGAIVARKLAERAPERIDRLVLMVPAGIVAMPPLIAIQTVMSMVLYRTFGSRAALARFIDSMLTGPDPRMEEYLAAALAHYKIDPQVPPLGRPEALAGFRRPTLVVGASDDVTAPGAAMLERARALFPHATRELLANCKHIPPADSVSRAKLCGLIASFLLAEDAASRRVAG